MKVGIMLPQAGRALNRRILKENVRRLEEWGYDSAWIGDHLLVPRGAMAQPYPYSEDGSFPIDPDVPFLEPAVTLGFLAACTERILLGFGVAVLPYRHPIANAKIATTLDLLSDGRLIFGVGTGWMQEEFDALGIPFKRRGQMTDEQIRCIVALWGGASEFAGEYYRFRDVGFAPRPTQQPRIPLWVGGDSAAARRRAALFGDAWYAVRWHTSPEKLAAEYRQVKEWAAAAGRRPDEVGLSLFVPVNLSQGAAAGELRPLREELRQLGEELATYAAVGVSHAVLHFPGVRQQSRWRVWETFAREMLSELHGVA
jgi:probable F420-dependent oxidoreductase